jgi:hypothetical protein
MRWLLLVVLVSVCFAQDAQKPQETPEQELERLIGRHEKPQETIDQEVERILGRPFGSHSSAVKPLPGAAELSACQAKVKEWDDWAAVNVPRAKSYYDANLVLEADNERLLGTNQSLTEDLAKNRPVVFFEFCGIGAGSVVALVTLWILWRKWRLSPTGKQLGVLMLGAAWMTVAVFVALNESTLAAHPINLAVTVVVYSLPAILFAGIAFWWFEKAKA